ncbi:hypothetical protein V1520DRAFT_371114 [Lipomyces starkeyi]|uniref:Sorting nexin MVP1 n=1 Tax=Lipomyces starkeyi NRRL Y-11557 TaxID=675824 RepID=A0A1E3QAM1_LIPST|nr:hypothetical protein LIPSTDRAFT_102783 [Lipomyces starkeyi NRRL Y-11557]
MSLFGDDYESGSTTTARSSLFGDPEPTPRSSMATTRSTVSSSGRLFDGNDSDPWSLPIPRASQKPTIATLLDPTKVPQVYNDSFDAENPVGGVLSVENVRNAIDRAGLSNNPNADRIIDLVIRNKTDNRIDRGTWCVAMALIGLLQSGEDDLGLDAVDSRRYSLPVTKLRFGTTRSRSAAPKPVTKTVPITPAPARTLSRQTYAPPPTRSQPVSVPPLTIPQSDNSSIPPTAMTPPSPSSPPGIPVADPWAAQDDDDEDGISPAPYSNAYSSNNYSSNAYSSDTYPSNNYASSTRSSNRYASNDYTADNYNSNYSSVLGADYNELARPAHSTQIYSDEPIVVPQSTPGATVVEDDDSDADEDGEANGSSYVPPVPNFPYTRAQPYYDAHEHDRIRVSIIPEKEGVFIFRHVNYLLEGASVPGADGTLARGGYRVVRRYSDFVWLLNCLLKRYPFRILPLLPPKRFAVNGHYLSSDEFFLERRRRGLSRFINELAKHPVLSREQLVVMFLSVPTELAVWRKQAAVSVEDEFTGRSLPDGLIESWNIAEAERWEEVKSGVKMEAELYTHLCLLIDRMEKRQESVAVDHQRFATSLNTLQDVTQKTYSVDTNDLSLINDGIKNVSKYLNNAQALLEDESRGWEIGVLEDFKRHRDTLISIKELFDRQEKLDVNTIPFLERRISNNESRLTSMRGRPDFKQSDVDRMQISIQRDRESIKEQHTRTWLIKECMRDELAYFQQTKYRVAKLFQDYAQERLKYAELFAENWRVLSNEISEVPTSAS